jgi:hypothetical protein
MMTERVKVMINGDHRAVEGARVGCVVDCWRYVLCRGASRLLDIFRGLSTLGITCRNVFEKFSKFQSSSLPQELD